MSLLRAQHFLFVLLLTPFVSVAQFNGLPSDVSLVANPAYPEPGETVTISLNDFTLSNGAAGIDWQIDGQTEESLRNQRSIQLTAGDIGDTTRVSATIRTSNQQIVSATTNVAPSLVTLIVEPYTSAPSWYKGRALPSVGSQVRVVALPQTGTSQSPESYSYTWRLNSSVANQGAVAGQYQSVLTMPFGQDARLTVDVSDASGQVVARRSIAIPNQEPEVYFYPLNPLRGVSRLALTRTTPLIGPELTVRAEPFGIGRTVSAEDVLFEWKVDGRTVENPNQDKQTITLQNGGGSGSFRVDFEIRSLRDLLQGAESSFNVTF